MSFAMTRRRELIRVKEISRAALAPVTRHEPGLAPRG